MPNSNESAKSEGTFEKIGGKIKNIAGQVLGDEQLEAEGKAKELKGEARVETAKAAERGKGAVEELKGAVKNRVGALVDSEQLQAEGKAEELKGQGRQESNKAD